MPGALGSTVLYLALRVSCNLIHQPKEQAEEQLTTGGHYLSWDVDPLGLVWEQEGHTLGQAHGSLADVQPGLAAGVDTAVRGQAARGQAQEQPKTCSGRCCSPAQGCEGSRASTCSCRV